MASVSAGSTLMAAGNPSSEFRSITRLTAVWPKTSSIRRSRRSSSRAGRRATDDGPYAGYPFEEIRQAIAARRAEEHFTRVVREGRAPDDVPEVRLAGDGPVYLPGLLVDHLGVSSTSEARRLIAQGGLRLDGDPVAELEIDASRLDGVLVQAGKRRFARVFVSPRDA
jgi:hypothetical protein